MAPRRDGTPLIIDADGSRIEQLERLELGDRELSEGWLQDKLFRFPQLLPIEDIDPGFGPLIPIGREISTPAGPVDNLYISPQGLLTLVEAKLWRNPEARRTVVGQILDYAKELSQWTYEDLDARARKATGGSLFSLVSKSGNQTADEPRFIDAVSRNLRAGRFLLLIVGDGIREEVELLAEFLQTAPQLRFFLSLVELQLYRAADRSLLVVPIVVARTKEIERAIVRVETTSQAQVDVSLDIGTGRDDDGKGSRSTLSREEFFEDLKRSDAATETVEVAQMLLDTFQDDEHFFVDWKSSSFVIKMRDPGNPLFFFTILVVYRSGTAYIGWLVEQLRKAQLPSEIGERYVEQMIRLAGCKPHPTTSFGWDKNPPLSRFAPSFDKLCAHIREFGDAVRRERGVADE